MRLRATSCIEEIHACNDLLAAAVWLLHKAQLPDDTLPVLLDYLPFAPTLDIEEELLIVLVNLGVERGRVRPVLLAALKDKQPARRAAAALIVGRVGTAEQKRRVYPLLDDTDPAVRLRAAQGLLAAGERRAIPALFTLLNPRFQKLANEADYLLGLASGDLPPLASAKQLLPSRDRKAWIVWWQQHPERIDLTGIVEVLQKRLRMTQNYRLFRAKQLERFRELHDFHRRLIEEQEQRLERADVVVARTERMLRLWGGLRSR